MIRPDVVHSLSDLAKCFPAETAPPAPKLRHRPGRPTRSEYPAAIVPAQSLGLRGVSHSPIQVNGVGLVDYAVFCSLDFSIEAPPLVEQLGSLLGAEAAA